MRYLEGMRLWNLRNAGYNLMSAAQVTFRTDASLEIGAGHVMRCLTLADTLSERGAYCRFICREHPGNLVDVVQRRGHEAVVLPTPHYLCSQSLESDHELAHSAWLHGNWEEDAAQTRDTLENLISDWLVVDHYALDRGWENALRERARHMMVIDDLADRNHECDLLLDQNLFESPDVRYRGRIPAGSTTLFGPHYALLRKEFQDFRASSLAIRSRPELRRLLIFMGGSDPANETLKVLDGVRISRVQLQSIDIIVGQSYAFMDLLCKSIQSLPNACLHVQTDDMASLLAQADLAITGGGSVTWEKCALGVPSLVLVLGDNQAPIAEWVHDAGAQRTLGCGEAVSTDTIAQALQQIEPDDLLEMSRRARAICDGGGTARVVDVMESLSLVDTRD